MQRLGIIGGMSWESTAIYYRLLNEGVRERLGGLHSADIVLHSVDFAPIAAAQAKGAWSGLGEQLAQSAKALEGAGAEAIVLATNTMHICASAIEGAVKVPLIHIADATADAVKAVGGEKPLLLATRFTMEEGFYRARLARHGLEPRIPSEIERADIHRIIYDELCLGMVKNASIKRALAMTERAEAAGADCIILGCTELCMLFEEADIDLPLIDSTQAHVNAALDFALAGSTLLEAAPHG